MPFDNNLILLDGTASLREARFVAPVSLTAGDWGAYARDIHGTAAKGMTAVMIVPSYNVTYEAVLEGFIEASDGLAAGWEKVGYFPKVYQYVRRVPAKTTTPPALADVGYYLYGGTTTDDGLIIRFDSGLFTASGTGNIYVAMVAADDLFDDVDEALTCDEAVGGSGGGTFVGVATAKSQLMEHGGVVCCRFATKRRYVRVNFTWVSGAVNQNFQKVMVGLVPYPFGSEMGQ